MVQEVTQANFTAEVIEASRRTPVLVDFWADWCGPCRMLAPVLEAIASRFAGRLKVVKVNVDQNPELAARYQVRGIPAVKLFVDGAVADEFTGAQPQGWIEAWLEDRLPREADRVAAEAERAFRAGDRDRAIAQLRAALADDPRADRARLKLVWMLIEDGRAEDAAEAFDALSGRAKDSPDGRALKSRIELARRGGDLAERAAAVRAAPDDAAARLRYADALAAAGRMAEAGEQYLEAMRRDRGAVRKEAQQGLLRLFELLGGRGELVDRLRGEMARVLFS